LRQFLGFCSMWPNVLNRCLTLADINHNFISRFINHLKALDIEATSSNNYYSSTKSIIYRMQKFQWVKHPLKELFPENPFPGNNKKYTGQKPLSKIERFKVVSALKTDLYSIFQLNRPLTTYEMSICILAIAIRSGMNLTPLLNLTTDCIKPHPIKKDRKILIGFKRRGNATTIQALRKSEDVEIINTIMPDIYEIIKVVLTLNKPIREKSPELSNYLFVCKIVNKNKIVNINGDHLRTAAKKWVKSHSLTNDSGSPLRINISRLRKTFINRIWKLSGGDPWVTAKMAGHSLSVSMKHYLEAPKESEKKFQLMGEIRTKELSGEVSLTNNLDNTPVSKCRDNQGGRYSVKQGNYCTDFISCVRCRNFVVTEDDLYRLFSFYWLIVYERNHIGVKKWSKYFNHIVRIIDHDIAPKFNTNLTRQVKERARIKPHPFWKNNKVLRGLLE